MQWINEAGLEEWAKRKDSRVGLAALLADLIRMTIDDASQCRFPSGPGGELPGWDGELETTVAKSFVPAGKSRWEFGTGPAAKKFADDYKKRTDDTQPAERAEITLVLVNLNTWDKKTQKITEWASARCNEKKWKDVKVLDGVQLVHWLQDHPAIAARYARDVLNTAPQHGALSTDEYWAEFSTQFKLAVTETLVIGGRQDEATDLIAKLCGSADSIVLGAESTEEAIAFAVAAIRSAAPAVRESLESRTLILTTAESARFFSTHERLVFFAEGEAQPLAGVLSRKCPTLSVATGIHAKREPFLRRPTASGMVPGFMEMGLDRDESYELAHRCGRSLTILKRLRYNTVPTDPAWMQQASALKPAFLAGGWSSDLDADHEILRELGGYASYTEMENVLTPSLNLPDKPLDREAEVWQVRAPVDAFFFYAKQLTETDLTRLQAAIVKVFSKQPEQPSPDQKFNLAGVAQSDYSVWLRDGLALTLLIIATMHESAGLHVRNNTPQQYVDDVITALPGWGRSHHSLIRLGNQTALLAEAAPNPFLAALESMLEGVPGEAAQIFETTGDRLFSKASPHVAVLWALEMLAWEPKFFNRAVLVIARLGQLDPEPDSNQMNRPINSLRSIFLGWSPSTYALQPQRIAGLDSVLRMCPDVGWQLLAKLLPRTHDTTSPTRPPRLRDFEPRMREEVTFGSVWNFESAVVDRAIVAATNDAMRVGVLVDSMGQLQASNRAKVIACIDNYLAAYQSLEGCVVWHALNNVAATNEYFADSDWAMTGDQLAAVKEVVERYRPADPIVSDRHVFDDWMPHVGKFWEGASDLSDLADPADLRTKVLQRVLDRDGVPGVLRLAKMVKFPDLLGQALVRLSFTLDQMFELLQGALEKTAPPSLSQYASAAGAYKFGEEWKLAFAQKVLETIAGDATKARLLLGWPNCLATWDYVERLGAGVREQYWRGVASLPLQAESSELLFAINQFRSVGRDVDLLSLVLPRIKELPSSLLLDVLAKAIEQINSDVKRSTGALMHFVPKVFAELRMRIDIEKMTLAKVEYAYLPLLRHESNGLTIIGLLASNPALFVDVLSDVYTSKNTEPVAPLTAAMQTRAKISCDLLKVFKTIPGCRDGKIDVTVLSKWVADVRALAAVKQLDDAADRRIGYVLAHSPEDGSSAFWPPLAVCEVIEEVASEDLERGFSTACFNKRGGYSKAINEGGKQERAIGERYRSWALAVAAYPRTAAVLMALSEEQIHDSKREDIRAEQNKMKR